MMMSLNKTTSSIRYNLPGQNHSDEYVDAMISEAPGSINFTMFLTLMGEKLSGSSL